MRPPISTPVSRRSMMARTGLVGAAGLLSNFNILRAQATDDKLIRVGLVGAGGRGSGAADQTLSVGGSNVKLTAIADAFDDRLQRSLTRWSYPSIVSSPVWTPTRRCSNIVTL
jgi:myo-inositol 2-dehydrogenase/D-chiro-inositol 1-dehydrogenase